MPSVEALDAAAPSNAANTKAENAKSEKVLDELLSKLTISKTADETSAAAGNIATFINGDIEEHDAPTKYVLCFSSLSASFCSSSIASPRCSAMSKRRPSF